MRWPWSKTPKDTANIRNLSLKHEEDLILELFRVSANASNVNVTQTSAIEVAAVFACVRVIATTLASLPLSLRRARVDGGSDPVTLNPLHYALSTAAADRLPAYNMVMTLMGNLALRGNGYARIFRDGNNQVYSLFPLEAGRVSPDDAKTGHYLYQTADGQQLSLAPDEVFHIRNFALNAGYGIDGLSAMRQTIALAIALDTNAAKYFANSSRMGSVFQTDNRLPPDVRTSLENRLKEEHEGTENAYRSLILENGLKLLQSRFDNRSSQFDESRKRQCEEIARFFGVPPHKIGIMNNVPRANAEEANIEFVQQTVLSYALAFEKTANVQLLTPKQVAQLGYFVKFNLNGLLRGATSDRFSAYATARQWGWLNVNEIRALEDLPGIGPDGDIYLQPVNMVEAGTEPEPDPQPQPTTPEPAPDPEDSFPLLFGGRGSVLLNRIKP